MKKFHLVVNTSKNGALEISERIEEFLVKHSCIVNKSMGYILHDNLEKDVECIITIGGDGTVINTARNIAVKKIPVIGINKGHLGYLTVLEDGEKLESQLIKLIENEYFIEKRMMIRGSILNSNNETGSILALNDIVITKSVSGSTIKCSIFVNGEYLNNYNADGIILSTPTGSTAYNLSAGGPIAKPDARMIILTPICPHSLNLRSLIFDSQDKIVIKLDKGCSGEEVVVFDGDDRISISSDDEIIIEKAEIDTLFIKLENDNYLDNIRRKMSNI